MYQIRRNKFMGFTRNFNTVLAALFLTAYGTGAHAGTDAFPNMPKIQPKKTFSVQNADAGEDLQAERGFGEQEPMVRMMNLMMVEGSGMEGMDMGSMKMTASNEAPPKHSSIPGMNMGSEKKSMAEPEKSEEKSGTFTYEIKAAPEAAKVGTNTLEISILNAGKPAKGLAPKAKVYMTSMDMGTEEPKVKEVSPGKYRVKVAFAMKGPWAVKLTTKGEEKEFHFNVGGSQ
jgi:hypothetical protein